MKPFKTKPITPKMEPSETKPMIPKLEPSETKPTKMEPSGTKPVTPKMEPFETKPIVPRKPKLEPCETEMITKLISKQTDIAMALTNYILQKNSTSNVVFSPLSLQLAIGLVAAGSEGETLKQLLSFLKAESTEELNSLALLLVKHLFSGGFPSGEPTLSLANGVWIDKSLSFKPYFSKVVYDVYKAASVVVDFQNKVSSTCFLFLFFFYVDSLIL